MDNLAKNDFRGIRGFPESPTNTGRPFNGDVLLILEQAVKALGRLDEGFRSEIGRLAGLKERLGQGRFHLAVLGQFKRGKSTLLNALLGEAVLPTAVIPVTAIPTFVRSGQRLKARVYFQDKREPKEATAVSADRLADFLAGFVTEIRNPGNCLGVLQVDVFYPGSILSKGVVLIDTPGVGSMFRHNTEAALNLLPQCDAALFLVSADPPITEVEIEFLRQVQSKVQRLFFILNKMDYLDNGERQSALLFLRMVLTEQVGLPADTPVFCVSAKEALEARRRGDTTRWISSGLGEVERCLMDFFASEKTAALRQAIGRKAGDVLAECMMRLRLAIRSLQIPREELQARLEVLERKIEEVQRQRVLAGDLLAGDSRRMHELLEDHAENLREKGRRQLEGIALEAMARNGQSPEREAQSALAEGIPGFFERLFGETTSIFGTAVADALRPHQKRAEELTESIRKTAAELFDVPYHAPESAEAFEMVQDPFWVTHRWTSGLMPTTGGLFNRLLPASVRAGRLRQRLLDQVSALAIMNVENLRWAIFQSINQTFTQFSFALDQSLVDTIAATQGAIRAAIGRRQQQSETVRKEAARLEEASADLERIRTRLVGE
jgi:GTP-binding protein EngB required for normal cell division